MGKWIAAAILIGTTIIIIYWAVSPLFITYAQVMPYDVSYVIGNKESIESAIIKAEHGAIEYMREILGDSIFIVSLLSVINALIAIIFIFRGSRGKNT